MRGALANVANVGQVRWTRGRCETGSNRADGQAVWSWHPDAGVKFAGSNFLRRWWLTSPVHQGEHGATVKPLRRECRHDFGEPCECACVFPFIAREAAGAPSIRHSLRPLLFGCARNSGKTSGAWRGEIAGVCLVIAAGSLFEKLHQHIRCRPGLRAGTQNHRCPFCAALERLSLTQPISVVMGPGVRRDDERRNHALCAVFTITTLSSPPRRSASRRMAIWSRVN
jgi:hypothetical protein